MAVADVYDALISALVVDVRVLARRGRRHPASWPWAALPLRHPRRLLRPGGDLRGHPLPLRRHTCPAQRRLRPSRFWTNEVRSQRRRPTTGRPFNLQTSRAPPHTHACPRSGHAARRALWLPGEAKPRDRAAGFCAEFDAHQPVCDPAAPSAEHDNEGTGEYRTRSGVLQIEQRYPSRSTVCSSRATKMDGAVWSAQRAPSASSTSSLASGAWWKRASLRTSAKAQMSTAYSG